MEMLTIIFALASAIGAGLVFGLRRKLVRSGLKVFSK